MISVSYVVKNYKSQLSAMFNKYAFILPLEKLGQFILIYILQGNNTKNNISIFTFP